MAALTRFFAHGGISTAYVSPASGRYSSDSVGLLLQPYIAREAITANTGGAQSTTTALTTNSKVKIVSVEIAAGKLVAIECNPPNRAVSADANSPQYSGTAQLECGKDWTFSVLEIATS